MKCPVCGKNVRSKDEFCDNCGAVLAGATAAAAVNRMAKAAAKVATLNPGPTRTCPNCQTANPSQEDFCQNCGVNLDSPPPAPAAQPASTNGGGPRGVISCPRCNNMIAPGDKFCRRCGYSNPNAAAGSQNAPAPVVAGHGANLQPLASKIGVGSSLGDKGRYQITRQIGSGGMGAVYLAEDIVLKRKVVIKALLQSDDPDLVQASIKEREFLAAVKHPNVVQIYDFLQQDTDGYIVMEYVNGKTLFSMLEERGQPFEPVEAIRYILGILPAFAYMHRLGLVYCDFKPQNIMLEEHTDGSRGVKLIDLGTVIRYEKNPPAVYGTQGFYAPEAVRTPSPETDLYTIARSLAYMISLMDLDHPQFGMPPAEHHKVFRDNPALYRLLFKATHPAAARRFKSVEELGGQLEGVLRVVGGGQPGMPVNSRLFDSGPLLSNKLGSKEIASLDEKDQAINLLRQGDLAFKAGQSNQALTFYSQAIGENPNSVDAHLRLAEMYIERDQFSQALAEINRAQKINPQSWKVFWYTGRLLEAQGNYPAALEQYRELAQDLPGELPPLLALARVHAQLGQYKEAVDAYRLVARANPDNTEALFGASAALTALGMHRPAAKALSQVGENQSRYVEAQQAICELFLHHKPDPDADDMLLVSQALRNLQQRGVETPAFWLARADFYRRAAEMAGANRLPPGFPLPHLDSDGPQPAYRKRQLGRLAEENYDHYLRRLPPNDPKREHVVREKFKVAPWRLF